MSREFARYSNKMSKAFGEVPSVQTSPLNPAFKSRDLRVGRDLPEGGQEFFQILGKVVEVIILIDSHECAVRIGVAPCFWYARALVPLAFNGFDHALGFANDVDFDAGVRSPEEVVIRRVGEAALFGEFHEDEVFPQCADVVAV